MRNWTKMSSDEIYALWNSYLKTDFNGEDPLNYDNSRLKIPVRLTPMEIIKLIEELFVRLIDKQKLKD